MKIKNNFFKKKNKVSISEIFKFFNIKEKNSNFNIYDIKDLKNAKKSDISFFNSLNYLKNLKSTKAKFIITNKKYESIVNKYSKPIIVDNVLKSVAQITEMFYPGSLNDTIDYLVKKPVLSNFKNINFGKNILIGRNVKIGKKTSIGHNTIIGSNVQIGSDCIIGSNVNINYTIIGNNVRILDGSIIGKKGFGFFPESELNYRYPHIGIVIIHDNVEIGANNTIDRGSISNTIIGKNTFIDNQVHIAHNVTIGKNCIITAQVGFAGSSKLGDYVQVGGQAGVSGHINIGNNVKIGGGSGVIKNIPDNTKVMGYPAKDIRKFIKENR